MKNVKIRLTDDSRNTAWLAVEYFPTRLGAPREIDQFYLTDEEEYAAEVPASSARKWMREAKGLASSSGMVITKGEYILNGKPTSLAKLGGTALS